MIVDPAIVPGLLLLAAKLAALAAVGYVVVRAALRQSDERMALAQGLVVGPAIWGLTTNFVLHAVPGLAGAAIGWGITLVLGAALVWRASHPIRPRPRVAAVFVLSVLALLWLTLASRQLLESPDPTLHLGLSAWIRAGGFPPEMPWNPGSPVRYHHAVDLLTGLLTPPVGPDLAFTQELLGAYAWTAFALVVLTALLRRSSWTVALIVAPLLLTAGAWTWTDLGGGILRVPVSTGLPAAGIGESLADIYWPALGQSWPSEPATLHDIWTPSFTLGYALAFVVLERAVRPEPAAWLGVLVLAGIVGFLGILVTSLAPVVLVLWAVLAAVHVARERCARAALRWGAGLALAVALMLFGGGAFTAIVDGGLSTGLRLTWNLHQTHWQALGSFDAHVGGVGVLGLGPVVVAGLAVLLARRDRLVVTLAVGAALLLLTWLVLSYPPAPWVLSRLAGHARNLALLALLLALTGVFSGKRSKPLGHSGNGGLLRSLTRGAGNAGRAHSPWKGEGWGGGHPRARRWPSTISANLALVSRSRRFLLAVLVVILVVWPTIAGPVHSLAAAAGNGLQLANANWVQREIYSQGSAASLRRFAMPAMSDRLAHYVRDHTPLDARVLTPEWPYWMVSLATGRPSSAGFADLSHLIYFTGPAYLDAVRYLEPAAIRRLGIGYIHATDAWTDGLPPRAQDWLADPQLFEFLEHDGAEELYRVRPAFLGLAVEPHPTSYEALRSVPSTTLVHLAPDLGWLDGLRVASALSHTRLTGEIDARHLHLQASMPWTVEPLGERTPDLVVLPASLEPSMFPTVAWRLVWMDAADRIAVYAPAWSRSRATNESPMALTARMGIG
ncbi:MAG: hypothetical protein OXU21_03160 [Chloroflexota bacterium]|nr:hypothetical protein [Chloroflexota bacterium]